jgi:glycogenin glucosyltransferase
MVHAIYLPLGGDQGLLNSYFSTWSTDGQVYPQTRRIPFLFNVTPSSFYSYLPAFKHFAKDMKVAHFIGTMKPWKWNREANGSVVAQ